MSFIAKLTLSDTEYNILNLDYEISKPMDGQHRPYGMPRGGIIRITLESSQKNEIVEWAVSPSMMKKGQIVFSKRDASASMKTVDFTDGYCVSYREVFSAEGQNPMQMQITISARTISINGAYTVTNYWPSGSAGSNTSGGGGKKPAGQTAGPGPAPYGPSGSVPSGHGTSPTPEGAGGAPGGGYLD